ncbi:hypothetical protein D3C87_1337710 [compost metagenome]
MPEFQATDFPITDNNEAGIAQAAIGAQRRAVLGDSLPPGQGQHLLENRFGEPGQVIADFHQRQAAGDFRSGHPQAVRQLEVTQGFHLLFEVVLGNPRQALAQLGGQLRRQGRFEQPAFVEQLIEQQRETSDLLGDPRARRAQRQQAAQRAGVFGQQNEISRTPRHGFHQWQHPFQHQIGIGVLHGLREQTRNKGIKTLTPQTLHGTQLRAAAQAGQGLQRFRGIGKTALLQLPTGRFFVLGFFPQRQPFTTDHHFAFGTLFFIGIGDHLTEMPGHTAAPVH